MALKLTSPRRVCNGYLPSAGARLDLKPPGRCLEVFRVHTTKISSSVRAAQLQALKEKGVKGLDGARWLGQQDKVCRVAFACAALGLEPTEFPPFLQQFLPNGPQPRLAFVHHPYSRQAPVFMKFCIGKKEFSAHEAAQWCVIAMPDRCELEEGTKTLNGFTQTAAALHIYVLLLETQDLLRGVPSGSQEWRTFKPMFESVAQFQASGRVLK